MSSTAASSLRSRFAPLAPSELGLVGQVTASWGAAGGLVAAMVVTAHMATGRLSSSLGFLTASIFFVGGYVVGFLHGGVLAYLGRPAAVSRHVALHRLSLAMLYAVPTLLTGWLVAMALALTPVALRAGRPEVVTVALVGWAAAAVALWWAGVETRGALTHLCRRWPGARSLLVVLGLAFLALLPVFVVTTPEIWVVGVRPTRTAAAMMAAVATLWIGGPILTLGALGVRAWSRYRREGRRRRP